MYRHVNLLYLPAVYVERLHVEPQLGADGKATVNVRARLCNPSSAKDEMSLALKVTAPDGTVVHQTEQKLSPWSEAKEITAFSVAAPQLWSPKSPALYRCTLTVKSPHGEHTLTENLDYESSSGSSTAPSS